MSCSHQQPWCSPFPALCRRDGPELGRAAGMGGMRQPLGPGMLLAEARGSTCPRPLKLPEPGPSGVPAGGCTCPVPCTGSSWAGQLQSMPWGPVWCPEEAPGALCSGWLPTVPVPWLGISVPPCPPSTGTHHPPAAPWPPWVVRDHPAYGGTRGDKCHHLPRPSSGTGLGKQCHARGAVSCAPGHRVAGGACLGAPAHPTMIPSHPAGASRQFLPHRQRTP